jgi:hypothetical protein
VCFQWLPVERWVGKRGHVELTSTHYAEDQHHKKFERHGEKISCRLDVLTNRPLPPGSSGAIE